MSGSHKADLRVRIGPVDLRVDGVSDQHILAVARQSCTGFLSIWHGDEMVWSDPEGKHHVLGYEATMHAPRWLVLSDGCRETRFDMARDNIPEAFVAHFTQQTEPDPDPEQIEVRDVIEVTKGEARFRIKTVTLFTGEISDEEARTIINRAARSVSDNSEAYGLDGWPSGLHWRDVAREIYEGWT